MNKQYTQTVCTETAFFEDAVVKEYFTKLVGFTIQEASDSFAV